eukprot:gb/GEZN01003175.1/.p1 GENE.gb/GEZN01003175.1/~~gb/GEZN01003175.1/.p1  ORF type:complete len:317 (+),score=37.07 gb/GEZN01003175.1/:108-1058(+)
MSRPRRKWEELEGGIFIDDRQPNVRMRMQKLKDGPHLPACQNRLEECKTKPDQEPVNFRRVAGELLGRFYDQAMDIAQLHGCKGHRRSQGKILYLWRCRFDDKCPARLRVIREPIVPPQSSPVNHLMGGHTALGSLGQVPGTNPNMVMFNPHMFNPHLMGAPAPSMFNWTELAIAQQMAQAQKVYIGHMGHIAYPELMKQFSETSPAGPVLGTYIKREGEMEKRNGGDLLHPASVQAHNHSDEAQNSGSLLGGHCMLPKVPKLPISDMTEQHAKEHDDLDQRTMKKRKLLHMPLSPSSLLAMPPPPMVPVPQYQRP